MKPTPRSQFELEPGLWLDARRAVFLSQSRSLLVADLHLGYAWAHRLAGNLLPIGESGETIARLEALVADYQPRELVILGDIVHRAVPLPALQEELAQLARIGHSTVLRLISGNHDLRLGKLLRAFGFAWDLLPFHELPPNLLLHGDQATDAQARREIHRVGKAGGRIFIGHEHPATSLGDGIASRMRCPCFVLSREVLVLPAFSHWAAGCELRHGLTLSAYSRQTRFDRAIAILAGKLLPLSSAYLD